MCDFEQCPACDASQPAEVCAIGVLGSRAHYRCKFCGWDWSRVVETNIDFETGELLDDYA